MMQALIIVAVGFACVLGAGIAGYKFGFSAGRIYGLFMFVKERGWISESMTFAEWVKMQSR